MDLKEGRLVLTNVLGSFKYHCQYRHEGLCGHYIQHLDFHNAFDKVPHTELLDEAQKEL